jgi:amidase/6-aminohexanoate-cyclic-dimer hydrolase
MPDFAEYDQLDALGLAALIAGGKITAQDALDAAIARAERLNPTLGAITVKLYDYARQVAAAPLSGPFAGVPFLLKDLGVFLAGTPTTFSSRLFENFVPDHDSTVVARYRAAGLVVFGKSATPEFGLAPSTEPAMFGPCRNPWNLAHSAGGSSGGAAAAVAAGILPLAHATDGGGSIRIPASACGLFGLKPTRARNPMGPDVGEGWGGQSTGHCVSRSVRDSAALLDATAGPEVGDPYWAPPPAGPYLDEIGRPPGRLRIALCVTPWNDEPVDPACRAAAEAAARLCESLGHDVTLAGPTIEVAALRDATWTVIAGNVQASLAFRAEKLGHTLAAADVEPMTWAMAERGLQRTAADYAAAMTVIHRAGRAVGRFFAGYDVLLTPTMCAPPWPLGVLSLSTRDPEAYVVAVNRSIGFTALFNAAGNPAMSVPLHWTEAGLPVGVQFVAPFGDEATLFRLAAQLEAAQPWRDRRPPLPA